MKILVTGAAGQLGYDIVREFSPDHQVTVLDRRGLDITDGEAVARVVKDAEPEVVINCAAYNDVDAAEEDPRPAFAVNATAVWYLANAAQAAGAVLVHFSTDFVFDGEANRPYTEDSVPHPPNLYSASKLAGEHLARLGCERAYICRVESVFGVGKPGSRPRNTVERIIRGLLEGNPPRLIVDRTISPAYAVDVARAVGALLRKKAPPGLYHVVNEGSCTWAELGRRIAHLVPAKVGLQEVPMAAFQYKARRPRYSALDTTKLRALGIRMPPWQDAIERFVAERRHVEGRGART